MAETPIVSNDWMVFVEGVEIPWQSIQFSSGVDQIANLTIITEPDIMLERLRPKAVCAVFMRDRYPEQDFEDEEQEILDGYFLYATAELEGIQNTKAHQQRGMILQFRADMCTLDTHKVFASGSSGNYFFGLVNGSTLLNPADLTGSGNPVDALSISVLGKTFEKTGGPTGVGALPPYRPKNRGDDDDFGFRMVSLVSWLSTHNASLRIQTVRNRMLNRICGLDDNTLLELSRTSVAAPMFQNLNQRATSEDSVLTIIKRFQGHVGYRMLTIPVPHYPDQSQQPDKGRPEVVPFPPHLGTNRDTGDPLDEVYHMYRDWYRNDYLFVPHLYYSAPPPCNFIFPDMIVGRTTSRMFTSEPTRSTFLDSTFGNGGRLSFVAPGDIVGENDTVTPAEFWASFRNILRPTSDDGSPGDSAYRSAAPGAEGANLLDFLLDEELERGIVSKNMQLTQEYMLAAARTINLRGVDGKHDVEELDRLRGLLKEACAGIANRSAGTAEDDRIQAYFCFVQSWLQYQHQLARTNRPTQLQLNGHRWLVPGFSAAIFDGETSYLTYVESVSFTVGADGSERTTADINRTRPLTPLKPRLLGEVEATFNESSEAQAALEDAVQTAYESDSATFTDHLGRMDDLLPALTDAATALSATTEPSAQATIRAGAAADLGAFQASYASIVGRARTYANLTSGPRVNVAGATTNRRDVDVVSGLSAYLDPAVSELPPLEDVAAARTRARDAVRLITRFNNTQVGQVRDRLPANAETVEIVNKINELRTARAVDTDRIEQIIAKVERETEVPVPPAFYNDDFINLDSLDQIYQNLLGCEPFYSGSPYAEGIKAEKGSARGASYREYSRMVKMFGRVFPAVKNSLVDETGIPPETEPARAPRSARSWDDVQGDNAGQGESSFDWQHRNFLRRRGQTLRQYLTDHGFKPTLDLYTSDEPTPTVFRVMVPQKIFRVGSREWDDTVICRIVDQNTRTAAVEERLEPTDPTQVFAGPDDLAEPQIVNTATQPVPGFPPGVLVSVRTVADATGSPLGGRRLVYSEVSSDMVERPKEPDPLIKERRRKAESPFLTTDVRQGIVIAFSRRHFGSRAFEGR